MDPEKKPWETDEFKGGFLFGAVFVTLICIVLDTTFGLIG